MTQSVGDLLRNWRQRRRVSQLDLAMDAEISQRHLSFIESGRTAPSREMVLRLADALDMPLRQRNALLLAAGFAPIFVERGLDHPAMANVRGIVEQLLRGSEPFPAIAVDRRWNMVLANRMVAPLIANAAPHLLRPPINIMRLSLHPDGIAPMIENFGEWRAHLIARLKRQREHTSDPDLEALERALLDLPGDNGAGHDPNAIAVTLRLRGPTGTLTFLSTTMVFGAPLEVNLSEMAIETFVPADAQTADALRAIHAALED